MGSEMCIRDSAVHRAQLLAAKSLTDLAETMAASAKLDEAITMQTRAVAVREVARDALAAAGVPAARAGSATDAQALRDALWRLMELQELAHDRAAAADSAARWQDAGGDAAVAAERVRALQPLGDVADADARQPEGTGTSPGTATRGGSPLP